MWLRNRSRWSAPALGVLLLVGARRGEADPATQAQLCAGVKLLLAKAVYAEAKCYQKARLKGVPVDPACVLKAGYTVRVKYVTVSQLCPGDLDTAVAVVNACVTTFDGAIAGAAKCAAAKLKAVGKKASAKAQCELKAALRAAPIDPACLAKAEAKFTAAGAKADGLGICTGTAAGLEALIDACLSTLPPPTTTTTTTLPCMPTTCAARGADCGTIPDGCGATLGCGACSATDTCGGGGIANVCGGGCCGCPPSTWAHRWATTADAPVLATLHNAAILAGLGPFDRSVWTEIEALTFLAAWRATQVVTRDGVVVGYWGSVDWRTQGEAISAVTDIPVLDLTMTAPNKLVALQHLARAVVDQLLAATSTNGVTPTSMRVGFHGLPIANAMLIEAPLVNLGCQKLSSATGPGGVVVSDEVYCELATLDVALATLGICAEGQTCGGQPLNVCSCTCGCIPTTCASRGANCGTIWNDCGGILDCGVCTAPQTCGGGNTPNVCGCIPTTCAGQSKNCGTISDGCGAMLDCGVCTPPQTCGDGGIPNVCNTQACFQDMGDGTIHDTCTGLQWEKKTTPPGLQNVNNRYSWAGCCDGDFMTCASPLGNQCQPNAAAAATCAAQADGGTTGCSTCASGTCNVDPSSTGALTTVWDWVNQVNAANFAGHSDWRLPSQGGNNSPSTGAKELETILVAPSVCGCDYVTCGPPPCIYPIFGPTYWGNYWSASLYAPFPVVAFGVRFNSIPAVPGEGGFSKYDSYAVRAVR